MLWNRAYKLCSTWPAFDNEIKRITQNLVNNNFSQVIIEKTMNKTIEKLVKNLTTGRIDTKVFYYKCYNAIDFAYDKNI